MKSAFKNKAAQLTFLALSIVDKVLQVFLFCTFLALLALLIWGKCQTCQLGALFLHAAALLLAELCQLCQLCTPPVKNKKNE
jgi:hypothetical protein